jgi:organic radical activating enzyme
MIKGLMGINGITVSGGDTSVPYIPQNTENPIQGMIRIWGTDMQVFTGSSWQTLSTSYATASLDQDILDILAWARKARDEDKELSKLAKDNLAVKSALENMRRAEEQLKTTIILSKDYEKTTS